MKLDENGQITVELLLLIGFLIIMIITIVNIVDKENELNIAMAAARDGAYEGINTNGLAIYSKESYDNYTKDLDKANIMNRKNIKIINISKTEKGLDGLNKTRIQIKVYLTSPNVKTKKEKDSLGDRVNYNIRKSITKSFKTENISNKLYNPAFSKKYSFTTADVEWI